MNPSPPLSSSQMTPIIRPLFFQVFLKKKVEITLFGVIGRLSPPLLPLCCPPKNNGLLMGKNELFFLSILTYNKRKAGNFDFISSSQLRQLVSCSPLSVSES